MKATEKQKADCKKRAAKWKAEGMCQRCGKPVRPGYARCEVCLAYSIEQSNRKRAARLCLDCSNSVTTGKTRCPSCLRGKSLKTFVKRYGCLNEAEASLIYEACLSGNCDICGVPARDTRYRQLCADHAHSGPPRPRGCLCHECNVTLGAVEKAIAADSSGFLVGLATGGFLRYLGERDHRYGGCFDPAAVLDKSRNV